MIKQKDLSTEESLSKQREKFVKELIRINKHLSKIKAGSDKRIVLDRMDYCRAKDLVTDLINEYMDN